MKSHMPRWPTRSRDPVVNVFAAAALGLAGILMLSVGGLILVPIAVAFGVVAAMRWYYYRPPPYSNPAIAAAMEQHVIAANFPDSADFADAYARRLIDAWEPRLPMPSVLAGMIRVAIELYELEAFNNPIPPLPDNPIDQARWRDEMRVHALKMHDAPQTLGIFTDALTRSFAVFRDVLPNSVLVDQERFLELGNRQPGLTVPALHMIPDDPKQLIEDLAAPFYTPGPTALGLFRGFRNLPAETGLDATSLARLFEIEVPLVLPDEARFAGHWILAPPGRGKTTLLHSMLLEDIARPNASLILMDSKGDLIDEIRGLANIRDRLIIIDPDPENPVAINPLDIGQTDVVQTIDLLEYLFASLLEFKLTALQRTLFRSVLRALVIAFPNPTLETFRDLLSNGAEKYQEHIANLPTDLQEFFAKDFNERMYVERRQEVLQRLRLLLENETMRAILTASSTRFHIGEAMDTGKIVVINNSKARLGDQGAEFFGRFFIAQVLAAAQQRATRSYLDKTHVYFYIDECQNVIARDEKIPTILDECRSQKIALVLAHQRTRQIASENVLDALSNCAIRFANSDEEARFLAPRLRTSQHFLQHLRRGKFAAFIRDVTPEAVAVSVNKVEFSAFQMLSPTQREALSERMRAQYGRPRQVAQASPSATHPHETDEALVLVVAGEASSQNGGHDLPSDLKGLPKPANTNAEAPERSPARPRLRPNGSRSNKDEKSEGASDWS